MNSIDSNNLSCSICQQKLFDGQPICTTLCGHVYHRPCIQYALHRYVILLTILYCILWNNKLNIFFSLSKPSCPLCCRVANRRDLVELIFSYDIGVSAVANTNINHNNQDQQQQQNHLHNCTTSVQTTGVAPTANNALAPTGSSSSLQSQSFVPIVPGRITNRRLTRAAGRPYQAVQMNFSSKQCAICEKFFLTSNFDVCDSCRRKLT